MLTKYLVAAAGLVFAAPFAAEAQGLDRPSQVEVTFHDLDLTVQGDVDALNGRVIRAAARVCEYRKSTKELWRLRTAQKCTTEAVAQSNQQVAQVVRDAKERRAGRYLVAR